MYGFQLLQIYQADRELHVCMHGFQLLQIYQAARELHVCMHGFQLLQIYQAKLAYLGWINLIEWVTYITALLLVISFNECQRQTGYRYVSHSFALLGCCVLTSISSSHPIHRQLSITLVIRIQCFDKYYSLYLFFFFKQF